MISLVFGSSMLHAEATAIAVWGVKTFGSKTHQECEKIGEWDLLQDSANVTYNAEAEIYITNSCHTGTLGLMDVVVFGTDITETPVAGLAGDAILYSTITGTNYKVFQYYQDNESRNVSGGVSAFYSEGYGVLSSNDRFLRYP